MTAPAFLSSFKRAEIKERSWRQAEAAIHASMHRCTRNLARDMAASFIRDPVTVALAFPGLHDWTAQGCIEHARYLLAIERNMSRRLGEEQPGVSAKALLLAGRFFRRRERPQLVSNPCRRFRI
jgi:hypothetical protein